MSGSVQKVRDGVYRVRVYVPGKPGTSPTKSRTFEAENLREAKKLANGHVADILAGVKATASKRGTVEELVDAWLEHQRGVKRSPTTLYRVQSITNRIVAELGAIQARELTARDVNAFYAKLRTIVVKQATTETPAVYMSESTVHHYHRVLRAILNYGDVHDMVDTVVTRKAARPQPAAYEVEVADDDVLERLFAAAPIDIQLAIKVDSFLGLRRGELFGLRWSDLKNGTAHISNNTVVVPGMPLVDKLPKGGRTRKVPMVAEIQHDLAMLRVQQEQSAAAQGATLAPDARILSDQDADPTGRTPKNPEWLSGAWRRHCKKHGVRIRLHDCRHWCASKMLAAGVPVNVVQEILGHATAEVLMKHYAHRVKGSDDVARAALELSLGVFALPAPTVT